MKKVYGHLQGYLQSQLIVWQVESPYLLQYRYRLVLISDPCRTAHRAHTVAREAGPRIAYLVSTLPAGQ